MVHEALPDIQLIDIVPPVRQENPREQAEVLMRKTEAFHIRGTHWVRVPASGRCPADFPVKAQFPGRQQTVCFKRDAARAATQARQRRTEQIPKIDEAEVRLRSKDFPDGKCANCRYFITGEQPRDACKIVTRAAPELVCDAFQGGEKAVPLYEVSDVDWLAFTNGMVKEQPYQHVVQRGFLTPEGPIVIIADTMKPRPHVFSLSREFHILHTTSEHFWTQGEVNRLIEAGRIQGA